MHTSIKLAFATCWATAVAFTALAPSSAAAEPLPPPTQPPKEEPPPVAWPDVNLPPGGVISGAGVGSRIAYGRPGVLELGGSAGLMIAPNLRNVNVSPSVGWFIFNNLEVSAILGVSNIKAGGDDATVFSALVETSYHLPFNRTMFGFVGLGIGGAYVGALGGGLAVAPRIGGNFLVGRSGVLTPSLSFEYTTHRLDRERDDDLALLALSRTLRVNIGYTVMW